MIGPCGFNCAHCSHEWNLDSASQFVNTLYLAAKFGRDPAVVSPWAQMKPQRAHLTSAQQVILQIGRVQEPSAVDLSG